MGRAKIRAICCSCASPGSFSGYGPPRRFAFLAFSNFGSTRGPARPGLKPSVAPGCLLGGLFFQFVYGCLPGRLPAAFSSFQGVFFLFLVGLFFPATISASFWINASFGPLLGIARTLRVGHPSFFRLVSVGAAIPPAPLSGSGVIFRAGGREIGSLALGPTAPPSLIWDFLYGPPCIRNGVADSAPASPFNRRPKVLSRAQRRGQPIVRDFGSFGHAKSIAY